MKTYIFTKEYKKTTHGSNVTCIIYKVKNNTPIYIGNCVFNTGSTMGAESEVFKKLIEIKEIPKKLLQLSQNSWRSAGYYCPEVENKGYTIKGL